MKQTFLAILLMLLPMMASAETVEIGGIWYYLIPKIKEAEVTSNPNKYSGEVNIPPSVTYDGEPYSVTSIGEYAFSGCSGLTSVTIPNSVTSIGESAFSSCRGLTYFTIPNSVTSIGERAFSSCTGLTSVTIPSRLTIIQSSTFSQCTNLNSITFFNNLTSIEVSAFKGCTSLTSLTFPSSLKMIGNSAFYGCTSLTSVTIPFSTKDIYPSAFAKCNNLTVVYCLAEKLRNDFWSGEGLYAYPETFKDSYPQAMTLHVPASAIEAYKGTEPWSSFKSFVPIGEGEIPETPKCATPTISLVNGEIIFGCETEGAEFVSEVTVSDAKAYYDNKVSAPKKFKVKVHATKSGYDDSDEVTEEFDFSGDTSRSGDVDGNGVVNVADHVELSKIILNQQGSE